MFKYTQIKKNLHLLLAIVTCCIFLAGTYAAGLWGPIGHTGTSGFLVDQLSVLPTLVTANETVHINVRIKNSHDVLGAYDLALMIDGTVEQEQNIILKPQETLQAEFLVTKQSPGTYRVSINQLIGKFKVIEATTESR